MAPVSVLTGFDCSSIEHYALVNDLYLWVSVYTLHSTVYSQVRSCISTPQFCPERWLKINAIHHTCRVTQSNSVLASNYRKMTFLSTPGNSLIHKHFGQISYHLPGQINSSNNCVSMSSTKSHIMKFQVIFMQQTSKICTNT